MCQCGCGERPFDYAVKLRPNTVLGVRIYDGCRDCHQGIGVDISAFDSVMSEYLRFAKPFVLTPDEFGGDGGNGFPLPIFEVRDLIAAAKDLEADNEVLEYHGITDWLEDRGLQLLQGARRHSDKRIAKEIAAAKKRKKAKNAG